MDYDERIQNLTQQIDMASRDVIIQDRVLGQARERVSELQGRINMLAELQQEEKTDPGQKPGNMYQKPYAKKGPEIKKPGPKPKPEKKRAQFRYPDGLRNFCIKNIDKMLNPELVVAVNEEFDLDMDYMRLMSFLKYNNIKRSKSSSKKKDLPTLPPEDY